MTTYLYLAEIEVYDLDTKTVTTLRYASGQGHVTTPSETPASTLYDARIAQAVNIPRHLFADGKLSGRSRVSYGDLVLQNADGALDGLLAYAMAGRPVTIRRGVPGAAYPSGFTTLFVGTVEQAEAQGDTLLIKMRDKQADLLVPLQTNQYGGTNVLPDGLDGVPDDLAGKRKPLCFGQVFNAPIPSVNTARLIYQVSDGLVNSVDAVYDAGVPLLVGFPMTLRTTSFTGTVTGIAYGADLFVAVTSSGQIGSSPDGTTWTLRSGGFGGTSINTVGFVNGQFIATGGSGKLATSPDGITWTHRTVGTSANLNATAYGNGKYVVVGSGGVIYTSADTITWSSRASGTTNPLVALTYGNGLFIAGGYNGTMLSSPDGVTWTPQASGFTSYIWNIAYGGRLFVAVGSSGLVQTSPDGVSWTTRDVGFGTNIVYATYYGPGLGSDASLYVVAGGAGLLSTSPDGVTWTLATSGFTSTTLIDALTFGDGRFVAGGFDNATATSALASSGAGSTYATLADLLDDTQEPVPGSFRPYYGASGSYVRLGASPYGQITADITQGASAAARTAGQLFAAVLGHAGKVSGDWSSSDVTALDAATSSAVCGDWIYGDDTIADVLDRIAASAGAWWGPDRTGVYRIQQLTAPAGTAAYTITANDAQQPLARLAITDDTKGLPPWRSIVQYKRNFAVQPGAGGGGSGLTNSAIVAGSTGQDLQTNTAVLATGSTTPRQIADRFAEVFNVKDYGATGDGATDDSAAIQRAVDAAEVSGGIVVFPTPGIYALGSTVTVQSQHAVHLVSDMTYGIGSSLASIQSYLKPLAALSDGMIKYASPTSNRYEGGGGNIRGLCFYDPANRTYSIKAALWLYDWSSSTVRDCHFMYLKGGGVLTERAIMSNIEACWFRYSGDTDKSMLTLGGTAGGGSNVTQSFAVSRCRFEVGYSAPYIMLPGAPSSGGTQNKRLKIHGCGFESDTTIAATQQQYIYIDTDDGHIDLCHFNRNTAVHVESTSNSIGWLLSNLESDSNDATGERFKIAGQDTHLVNAYVRGGSSEVGTAIRMSGSWNSLTAVECRRGGNVVMSGADAIVNGLTLVDLDTTQTHALVLSGSRGKASDVAVYSPNDTTVQPISLGAGCIATTVAAYDIAASGTGMASGLASASGELVAVQRVPGAGAGGLALYDGGTTPAKIGEWSRDLFHVYNRQDASASLRVTAGSTTDQVAQVRLADKTDTAKWALQKTAANAFALLDVANNSQRVLLSNAGNGATQINADGTGVVQLGYASTGGTGFYSGSGVLVASVSSAGDFDGAGGFAHTVDGWYQDNVAASQTNVELTRATGRWTAVRGGSVLGVVVHSSEARTAGTLTVDVYKNTGLADAAGSSIGLTAVLDGTNTSRKATTQAKDTDTFVAGDELYAVVTTDGSWTPTTADIRVSLLVEC